jgi:hypothetical protein
MNYNEMFLLQRSQNKIAVTLDAAIKFDQSFEIMRATRSIDAEVVFHQVGGYKWFDMLGTTSWLTLVSDRVVRALESERVTGWIATRHRVLDRSGNVKGGYYVLCVHGRAAGIDDSRSTRACFKLPDGRQYCGWKGIYVRDDKWDQSDMFTVGDTALVGVTSKVVNALRGCSNITFSSLLEAENVGVDCVDDDVEGSEETEE